MTDLPTVFHPRRFASERPDHPAVIMGSSGSIITYAELDRRANRLAHVLRGAGLATGDGIVIVSETTRWSLVVAWAAQRAGLIHTPVNHHLRPAEMQHVLDDCGATALVVSPSMVTTVADLDLEQVSLRLVVGDGEPTDLPRDFTAGHTALAAAPSSPIADEAEGREMVYSGGTTGRPKGIRKPVADTPIGDPTNPATASAQGLTRYGIDDQSVYLSPAPLYHAAPLVFSMSVHRLGGTVVLMESFDASLCLDLIEMHRVTHAQFVPTMFTRMLRLPRADLDAADISSLRLAIHAAAPCPIPVKQQMIEWWGPILFEYYAGTEDIGHSSITSEEWLAHPGSVGRPAQPVHVLDADGQEVPPGETGVVYFEGGRDFSYQNDPEATAAAANEHGWRTLGDIGRVDADGYLYLTDRVAHTIIVGGVNIYPREVEDVLIMHPAVSDVAVIGVPDADLGEVVHAVVQPIDPAAANDSLAAELLALCRTRLATLKCPRSIDFDPALPRDPNGKLFKRLLRDRYWEGHDSRIV